MNWNNSFAIASVVIRELLRRKDFYVLFILTVLITGLAGSINFFDDPQIVNWLKELSLTLIWVSSLVIAITTTARQLPAERESRTIFPLLAKPITRAEVVVGKFIGCWQACGAALVVFYLFFGVMIAAKGGSVSWETLFLALILHWALLGIVISMSLLGSLLFTSVSANVTICFIIVFGILFAGLYLGKVADQQPEPVQTLLLAVYYLIPQLGFFYEPRAFLIHGGSLEWFYSMLAVLYALAYSAVFLTASWLAFRRKALN